MPIILSNNSWLSIPPPVGHDPSWLSADSFFYATMFVAAKEFFPHDRAVILAEAAVNKRLYPGIVYDSSIEDDLLITRKQHETPKH